MGTLMAYVRSLFGIRSAFEKELDLANKQRLVRARAARNHITYLTPGSAASSGRHDDIAFNNQK